MKEMLRVKPRGWSVVWREGTISVRPPERDKCKFSITESVSDDADLTVGRFDRALNYWTGFTKSAARAEELFEHLASRVDEGDGHS